MKFQLQCAVLAVFLLFSSHLKAQDWVNVWQDDNTSFAQKQAAWSSYFSNKDLANTKGWKQFKRWEYFYQRRMGAAADDKLVKQKMLSYFLAQPNMEAASTSSPASASGTWTYIGPSTMSQDGGAGRINFTSFHPLNGNVYVGAPNGGLWKNSAGAWSTNTDQLSYIGFSDLIINPANPSVMMAATGDADAGDAPCIGVLKSTDGGVSWVSSGLTTMSRIHKLLFDPSNFNKVFAATNSGIWLTTNGGTSWGQVLSGARVYDLEFKPGDASVVYAVTAAGYFRSTDGGNSFPAPAGTGLPASGTNRRAIAVSAANADYIYMVCGRSDNSGLHSFWKSTDAGISFTKMLDGVTGSLNLLGWNPGGNDAGGQSWYDLAIAASPTNAEVVVVGGVNVWRTSNGGTNWSLFGHWYGGGGAPYCHADCHNLTFGPTGDLYASTDGGIFRATNVSGAPNFTDLSSGLHIAQMYRLGVSQTNNELLISGWQDNGTNLRKSAANDWEEIIGGDGMECAINPADASIMLGELYYGNIRKSTNGGNSFFTIAGSGGTAGTVNENGDWVTPYVISKATPSTYYVGKTTVYKSTNSGAGFDAAAGIPTTGSRVNAIATAPSNSNYVYAAKGSVMYVSTDGQNYTNRSTGLSGNTINYITVHGTDPATAWVVMSGYTAGSKVFKTTNGGVNWINVSGNMPNVALDCITVDEQKPYNQLYVGTETGVYYTNDTLSAGWITFEDGLPNVEVSELEIQYNSGTIKAATYGRGAWTSDLYSTAGGGCVASAPLSNFSANALAICSGQQVAFTNLTNSCGNTYTWSFPGGTPATSNLANPVVTYSTAGTYAVSLTTTNAAGNNTKTAANYIQVRPLVTPAVSISAPKTSICAGEALTFTAVAVQPGTSPQYRWFKAGSPVAAPLTASSITLTNISNGETITCELTSNVACATNPVVVSSGITITVNPVVTPSIAISTPRSSICLGENVVISTAVTDQGTNPVYTWYNGSVVIPGITGNTLTINTLASGNTITARLTSNAACATNPQPSSNAITFTVTPTPAKPVITQLAGDLISSATQGNQWFINGAFIPGATTQMYHPVKNGSYTVQSTINNCTGPMSDPFALTIEGVNKLYPVPNNGQFVIDFYVPEGATSYSMAVFNAVGQLMHQTNAGAVPGLMRVNMQLKRFAAGAYQVVIIAGGNTYRKRMLIE